MYRKARPRDTQVTLCYVFDGSIPETGPLTQELVTTLNEREVRFTLIKNFRRTRMSLARPTLGEIELAGTALKDRTVLLHEVAHLKHYQVGNLLNGDEPHGPEFVGHYLNLLAGYTQYSPQNLSNAAYVAGLKVANYPLAPDSSDPIIASAKRVADKFKRFPGVRNAATARQRRDLIQSVIRGNDEEVRFKTEECNQLLNQWQLITQMVAA